MTARLSLVTLVVLFGLLPVTPGARQVQSPTQPFRSESELVLARRHPGK